MFNAREFLSDHFTDADGVVGLLGKHGAHIPQREAARKWFERGSLPADWIPVLFFTLEREYGAPISLARYFGDRGNADIFA